MDILKGNIKSIYFKYLIAAFGGTLIPCIYSVVDVAMVGKYHGPSGPAALAVFAPLWNIIYGLGLLAGYPIAQEEAKGAWKECKLEAVKAYILEQM